MTSNSFINSCGLCRILCLVLILRSTYGTDVSDGGVDHKLPRTNLKELSDFIDGKLSDEDFLRDAGGQVGVFAVTDLGSEYSEAVDNFRAIAPKCLENFDSQLPVSDMSDGSKRRTYATQDKVYPGCVAKSMKTMSSMYDTIESKVSQLIQKLDGHNLAYMDKGKKVQMEDAPVKDHLHVYSKTSGKQSPTSKDEFLVPFHIDNGLFLLLTPFPSPSLTVRLSDSSAISTNGLRTDSILVLMGRGLTDWLLQNERQTDFHPVPHAVPSLTDSSVAHRAVYARMKVAPLDAIPAVKVKGHHQLLNFGDIFYDKIAKNPKPSPEDLCSGSVTEDLHLQHWQKRSMNISSVSESAFFKANDFSCDNPNEAYCWMGCYPLPSGCNRTQSVCYNENHEACNTVDDGPPHDPTCKWHCKNPKPDSDDKFCAGGMDMLMGGFEVAGGSTVNNTKTCVILFFKSWKLNSGGKFAAACVGVFALGFCIEAIIALRRKIVNRKRIFINIPMAARKILVISLFGVNLILGYLAMLVAMTYSVELFICVVAGLILGHGLLNSHMPIGESIDPCCASQNHNDSSAEDHSPIARTPCDNVVYQEMATNGATNRDRSDPDTHSLCNCDDATSNTNIKV